MADLAEEARADSPDAVAELDAFGSRFSLARQLAARRRGLRLSQRQLSERTGIERAEIRRIERGEADVTMATLGAPTRALGVGGAADPGRVAKAMRRWRADEQLRLNSRRDPRIRPSPRASCRK